MNDLKHSNRKQNDERALIIVAIIVTACAYFAAWYGPLP